MKEVILLLPYLIIINTFQFLYPSVTVDILTINTPATYSFYAMRNLDDKLNPTPFSTQPVPALSNIIIVFPSQYNLTKTTPACSSLLVNDGSVINYTTSILGNNLTISNAITSSLAVANVSIVCSNITNPYPALSTDPFLVVIGQDISSSATTITLTPAAFQICNATFTPSYVNTTGAMVLYLSPKNYINNNGFIQIQFPSNLQWSQDVSTSHPLPIASASCSIISGQVKTGSCSGLTATATVQFTISSLSSSSLNLPFSFSIGGLFSPPTTNPPDSLIITSYDKSSNKIDTCTTTITGLVPQQLSVSITATTNPLIVNAATSLAFVFTLTDTLTKTDYFQIIFPSGSIFSFLAISAVNLQLFISGATYSASNSSLIMRQSSVSPTRFANTLCRISISSYTAPPSTKPTESFILQVYNYQNGLKMQGSATLTAQPNTYVMSVAAASYSINQNTRYTVNFTTLDFLTNTSYVTLGFPNDLTLNISTNCLTSNFSSPATSSCSSNSSNVVRLDSLTTNGISANSYAISIDSIINPNRAVSSLYFWANFYYINDSSYLVASANFSGLIYIPNVLNINSTKVVLSDYHVLASSVSANITFTLKDTAPLNSYLLIHIPPQIAISGPGPQCTYILGNASVSPACSISGQIFRLPFDQAMPANTTLTIILNGFGTNPKSTRPTSTFQLYIYSNDNYIINYLNSSLAISNLIPIALSFLSISPSNYTNSINAVYSFYIQQLVAWDNSSFVVINLPPTIVPENKTPLCIDLISNTNLSCSVSNNTAINVTLTNSQSILSLSIKQLKNSPSFRTSSYFTVTTYTSDGYMYASDSSVNVTTNSASFFNNISYSYSNPYYNQTTNLTLNIINNAAVTSTYIVSNFLQFTNGTNISCISSNSSPNCIVNGSDLIISSINSTFPTINDITIMNLFVPLTNVTQLGLKSYDNSHLMSTYSHITFQAVCSLPCYTCVSASSPLVCLSCYSVTLFTNKIYYSQNNCYTSCPATTFSNNNSLVCQACSSICGQCSLAATNCTQCVGNSSQPILYLPNRTCLSACPSGTFPSNSSNLTKYTSICTACVSPCSTCITATICLACTNSSLYYYNSQCIATCPVNITVANVTSMQCELCSPVCLACVNTTTTCLSCNISVAPIYYSLNQTCVSTCPTPLVVDGTTCSSCNSPCNTCSVVKTNCTSCVNNTFQSMVANGSCLSQCDQYYFGNSTSNQCQQCSSVLGLNCKNCLNSSVCITCDQGFVFYDVNSSCLTQTPSGYTNISGIAVVCISNCSECNRVSYNCTSCNGIYSFYFFAGLGYCQTNCPLTSLSFNNTCITCTSPCLTCINSLSNCSSCITGYLLLVNGSYICTESCPNTTFYNYSSSICENCTSPCLECLNSALHCTSCLDNSYYTFNQTCVSSCPNNSVINNFTKSCYYCLSPCLSCSNSANNCTSCINGFYFYSLTNQCLSSCPIEVSVVDPNGTFTCVGCTNNCYTCSITPNKCLSCSQNYSFFNSTCVVSCPSGLYSASNICTQCLNNCSTCVSATSCLTCLSPKLLYQSKCISSCPVNSSIIINNTCTPCSKSCLNCSAADYCFSCPSSTALFQGTCVTQCPAPYTIYYNTSSNKLNCFTNSEIAAQNLQNTLKISAVLPLPFTIITTFIFLCCLMSKIQNIDTYIFGVGYSLYGCAQAGSLVYLLYIYAIGYSFSNDYPLYSLLLFISISIIAFLNLISLICVTPFLTSDPQFNNWLKYKRRGTPQQDSGNQKSEDAQTTQSTKQNDNVECCSHTCTFAFFTIFSFVVSNKLRLLIFTKLFKFNCLTAHLQNVHGFRAFNVLSFFGLIHEGIVCFITIKLLMIYGFSDIQLYLATIDCLIVTIISVILAFLVTQKEDNFFKIHNDYKDGVDLGRRKKEKGRQKNMKIDQKRMKGMDSRDKLIDLHDEHSQVEQEIIVNHNIPSTQRPKKVSAFWVEVDQNTRGKNISPRNDQTRNIFQIDDQYDEDKYTPLTEKERIELFHTSIKPNQRNKGSNLMQSRANDWAQVDDSLKYQSKIKQRGQSKAIFNSSIESELTSQTKKKLNLQRETVNINLHDKLLPKMGIIRQLSDPTMKQVDSNEQKSKDHNSNFGQKGSSKIEDYSVTNKIKEEEIIVIQEQNEELNKTFQKIPQANNISFESILPFVHYNGILIQKQGKNKSQEHKPKLAIVSLQQQNVHQIPKNKTKSPENPPIIVPSIPPVSKVQKVHQKQVKPLQELLDMSQIVSVPLQKKVVKVESIGQQVQVQDLQPIPIKSKIPKQIHLQHRTPILSNNKILTQQIMPVPNLQPKIKNKQPSIPPQVIKPQTRTKSNLNLGFNSYQMSQRIQPQPQSVKNKPIIHAPRVYTSNKVLQIDEGNHNQNEFQQQILKRQSQLFKIKQELIKNNQIIQRNQQQQKSKRNSKQSIKSYIDEAIKSKRKMQYNQHLIVNQNRMEQPYIEDNPINQVEVIQINDERTVKYTQSEVRKDNISYNPSQLSKNIQLVAKDKTAKQKSVVSRNIFDQPAYVQSYRQDISFPQNPSKVWDNPSQFIQLKQKQPFQQDENQHIQNKEEDNIEEAEVISRNSQQQGNVDKLGQSNIQNQLQQQQEQIYEQDKEYPSNTQRVSQPYPQQNHIQANVVLNLQQNHLLDSNNKQFITEQENSDSNDGSAEPQQIQRQASPQISIHNDYQVQQRDDYYQPSKEQSEQFHRPSQPQPRRELFRVEYADGNLQAQQQRKQFTVENVDQIYKEEDKGQNSQSNKMSFELKKTAKRHPINKKITQEAYYDEPEQYSQEGQTVLGQVRRKGLNVQQKPDEATTNKQHIANLLKNVIRSRSKKQMPKQDKDQRISIKMQNNRMPKLKQPHQNSSLARKSMQKNKPINNYKIEHRNQQYQQEPYDSYRPTQNTAHINLVRPNQIDRSSSLRESKPVSRLLKKEISQAQINNPKPQLKMQQIRQFDFGQQISSDQSKYELLKWKSQFAQQDDYLQNEPLKDKNPDLPIVSKIRKIDEDDGLEVIKERRSSRKKSRQSKPKTKKEGKFRNEQLNKIYGK